MNLRRYFWIGLILVLLLFYGPSVLGGYSYSEGEAIRKSYPHSSGEIVFEKKVDDHKVVVRKVGDVSFVLLVDQFGLVLHRVTHGAIIQSSDPNKKMKKSWSARRNKSNRYDTLFAVETQDPSIKKVIVSNEGYIQNLSTLEEVKKRSALYQEMDIVNGYAAVYVELDSAGAGSFVFRGLNERGEIVLVDW